MDARRTGRLQMVLDDHGARASAAESRLRNDGQEAMTAFKLAWSPNS